MTIVQHPATKGERVRREIDDVVLHINGLVRVRELLRSRGASEQELEEHSAEIGRLQWRLARLVRNSLEGENAAA